MITVFLFNFFFHLLGRLDFIDGALGFATDIQTTKPVTNRTNMHFTGARTALLIFCCSFRLVIRK